MAARRSWHGLVLNALLSLVAFGLLYWTVWSNRAKLAEVRARNPDLRLFVAAVGLFVGGPPRDLPPLALPGPCAGLAVPPSRRRAPGIHRERVQPGDPGRGGRRRDQGGLPLPRAGEENAGRGLDGDRPGTRPPRPVRPGRRRRGVRLALGRRQGPQAHRVRLDNGRMRDDRPGGPLQPAPL